MAILRGLMNGLGIKKGKKSLTDLVIERSIELLGCTLDERSDENLKWMRENGYRIKKAHKRGRARGRRR
ncbi:hypothetical protein AC482_02710 [miscellaneous Crenarchaeota group-15 archaeon DG-45]|uniref:Uncharacterized protein n=1 Tax=miscellaneous Crenarchaeota group-15 archaeon DG-45 TaxID=1685127 RepID=A0A0M0BQL4_9ARCH|nr:MAG: hypothetical protein AC482_02710 [miscellaneous Crenarchaeota group-15 archaeon DG-45]